MIIFNFWLHLPLNFMSFMCLLFLILHHTHDLVIAWLCFIYIVTSDKKRPINYPHPYLLLHFKNLFYVCSTNYYDLLMSCPHCSHMSEKHSVNDRSLAKCTFLLGKKEGRGQAMSTDIVYTNQFSVLNVYMEHL